MEHTAIRWDPKELGIFETDLCPWQVRMVHEGYGFRKEGGSL